MSLASAETSCPVGRPTIRGSNETVEGCPQACGMPKVGRPWLAGPKAVDRPLKLASVATVERLNPVRRVRLWKAVERPLKLASVETVERLRSSRPLALLALELELARREKGAPHAAPHVASPAARHGCVGLPSVDRVEQPFKHAPPNTRWLQEDYRVNDWLQ